MELFFSVYCDLMDIVPSAILSRMPLLGDEFKCAFSRQTLQYDYCKSTQLFKNRLALPSLSAYFYETVACGIYLIAYGIGESKGIQ